MRVRLISVCLLSVTIAVALPSVALGAPGDPPAGSPPGVIYELPVDKGRSDAAPRDGRSVLPGDDSYYRSENNFGSSSEVPGDPSTAEGKADDPDEVQASTAGLVDSGNTSEAVSLGLIGLTVLTAVGVGLAAARRPGS